jgi:hypothetical protein
MINKLIKDSTFIKSSVSDDELIYHYFTKNNTRDKILYTIYTYSSGNKYISYSRIIGIKLFGIRINKKIKKIK